MSLLFKQLLIKKEEFIFGIIQNHPCKCLLKMSVWRVRLHCKNP